MVIMTYKEMENRLNSKIVELSDAIDEMQSPDCTLSANTVKTQTQVKRHEVRNLMIMRDLVRTFIYEGREDAEVRTLSDTSIGWFMSATTLVSDRKAGMVSVQEGDRILDLLQKYQDVNNLMDKLQKACKKEGLVLDMASGIIRK